MNYSTQGLPVHHQLLKFTQTHAHWVGDAIQPSHPLSSPCPPALNPGSFLMSQLFTWGDQSIRTFNEHPGLISFRMDWLDLLALIITELQIKTTWKIASHPLEWLPLKESIKWWQGWGEIGTFVHCEWGYKMMQPLWKTVWGLLKN